MSMEQRAKILQAASLPSECGIRNLALRLKMKTSKVISILQCMEQEGLVEVQPAKTPKRGRPKKRLIPTPLGNDFLALYKKLVLTRLMSTKADLAHATKDAQYAQRLADRGHFRFELFLELNNIAGDIKKSK